MYEFYISKIYFLDIGNIFFCWKEEDSSGDGNKDDSFSKNKKFLNKFTVRNEADFHFRWPVHFVSGGEYLLFKCTKLGRKFGRRSHQ